MGPPTTDSTRPSVRHVRPHTGTTEVRALMPQQEGATTVETIVMVALALVLGATAYRTFGGALVAELADQGAEVARIHDPQGVGGSGPQSPPEDAVLAAAGALSDGPTPFPESAPPGVTGAAVRVTSPTRHKLAGGEPETPSMAAAAVGSVSIAARPALAAPFSVPPISFNLPLLGKMTLGQTLGAVAALLWSPNAMPSDQTWEDPHHPLRYTWNADTNNFIIELLDEEGNVVRSGDGVVHWDDRTITDWNGGPVGHLSDDGLEAFVSYDLGDLAKPSAFPAHPREPWQTEFPVVDAPSDHREEFPAADPIPGVPGFAAADPLPSSPPGFGEERHDLPDTSTMYSQELVARHAWDVIDRLIDTNNGDARGHFGGYATAFDRDVWHVTADGVTLQVNDGVTPTDAIESRLSHPDRYSHECATETTFALTGIYVEVLRHELGASDQQIDDHLAGLRVGPWNPTPTMRIDRVPMEGDALDLSRGDVVRFTSSDPIATANLLGRSAENVMYMGPADSDGRRWTGGESTYYQTSTGLVGEQYIIDRIQSQTFGVRMQARDGLVQTREGLEEQLSGVPGADSWISQTDEILSKLEESATRRRYIDSAVRSTGRMVRDSMVEVHRLRATEGAGERLARAEAQYESQSRSLFLSEEAVRNLDAETARMAGQLSREVGDFARHDGSATDSSREAAQRLEQALDELQPHGVTTDGTVRRLVIPDSI